MILIDTEGRVHHDEESVSENITRSLTLPENESARLIFLADYNLLYRYNPDGDIDIYFVGKKPFHKLHMSLFDMHAYQDHEEFFSETCRICRRGDTEVSVYIGHEEFIAPESLLTLW